MSLYTLHKEQTLKTSIDEAWDFFSSPYNLSKITPSYMNFQITNNPEKYIYEGMKIEYLVSPVGKIPLHWITEITEVNKPFCFIDFQRKGPYKLWEHKHTFEQDGENVIVRDVVKYELPLGFLGNFAHLVFVKHRLKDIFDYRENILKTIFSKND